MLDSMKKNLSANEKITIEMMEDKAFCLSIMKCKSREEVKLFLISKGIDVNDSDIDDLAKNISEIEDICKRLDDSELDNIVGGVNAEKVGKGVGTAGHVLSIAAMIGGGLMVLSVIAAGIKKLGDRYNWWHEPAAPPKPKPMYPKPHLSSGGK